MGAKPNGLDFLKRLGGHENKFLYFKASEFVPKIRNQKRTTTGFMRKVKMTKSFSNRKQFKTRAIRNITNPVGSKNKKKIPEWFRLSSISFIHCGTKVCNTQRFWNDLDNVPGLESGIWRREAKN